MLEIVGINELLSHLRDCRFEQTDETEETKKAMLDFAREVGEEINSEDREVNKEKIWYLLDVLSTIHQLVEMEDYNKVDWVYKLIDDTFGCLLGLS